MNSDKQRAAIALYCGWKIEDNEYKRWTSPNGTQWNYPPAYDKDLNVMHEAEKILSNPQWQEYGYQLEYLVLGIPASLTLHDLATVAHATAAQRAEAFLKTIGEWKE